MNRHRRHHASAALFLIGLLPAALHAQTATPDPPQPGSTEQRPLIPVPPAPKLPIPDLRTPDDKPVHRALQGWGKGMDRAASSMGLQRQEAPADPQSQPADASRK